jgi:hypothetical protein
MNYAPDDFSQQAIKQDMLYGFLVITNATFFIPSPLPFYQVVFG